MMPLLLCPNDNSSMQTVDRAGVQFDMCPTCRGVWLDRGELEKLVTAGGQGSAARQQGAHSAPGPPERGGAGARAGGQDGGGGEGGGWEGGGGGWGGGGGRC